MQISMLGVLVSMLDQKLPLYTNLVQKIKNFSSSLIIYDVHKIKWAEQKLM